MIGSNALLASLENHGVREVFAYPGGAVLPIYDEMPKHNIRRILVRHEQAAAFAAQGYSRSTQNVGVCLATSGPGATNLVTGIADAMMDSIPMVAITGNVFKHLIGSDAFQETDIVGICQPIVKHAYFVEKADDIPRIMKEAFHLAASGRPGPVLVDIPKCIQIEAVSEDIQQKIKQNFDFPMHLPGYAYEYEDCPEEVAKAAELIEAAERPVIIYGHGVILSNAEKALADFIEKSGIPNVWTLHGIGGFDGTHPLSLGMLGMHGTGAANFAVHNADLILGIGIRFDDRITGKLDAFKNNKKIIHFDIDPSEFNKNVPVEAQLCGQIHDTLPKLTQALINSSKQDSKTSKTRSSRKPENSADKLTEKVRVRGNFVDDEEIQSFSGFCKSRFEPWTTLLQAKHQKWPLDTSCDEKFTEICVINKLYERLEEDDVVVVDVGQHEMWSAQRFFPKKSRKFLASGGLGSMGFSFPAAIGATFSGHNVWSISGDGGFQMNLQELATVVQDKIPVKIIILNNAFLGMVRQWQELFYDKNYVDTPLFNPDYVKLGEAYGIPSFRAENHEEAERCLQKMKTYNDGPILVEFKVKKEENVFPMVPQGKALGETMLNIKDQIDHYKK